MIKLSVTKLIIIGLVCACIGGIAMFVGMAASVSGDAALSNKMQFWSAFPLGFGFACMVAVTISTFKKS